MEKFTNFGDLLRFLRRRVSLTQLELAIAVGYSHTQISRLEQNLRLPDIPTIESNFVYALGIEDEPKVLARLLELAANVRREDAPAPGLSPYKGLNYYDEGDADLFVGREALTAQLVENILSLTSSDNEAKERFFAIVGASGSGKSSLVRAGLVPALRWDKTSNDWRIHVLTPTEHPLESLAITLTLDGNMAVETDTLCNRLSRESGALQQFVTYELGLKRGACLLLVVDQFEELFALCRSEEERAFFIENLLSAVSEPNGPVMVIITLRADFYAHCAAYPQLRDALARHQKYIGTMTDEELRRAIEESAQRGRWVFEPGLVDLLMHDVGHEPGALPLLSHALLETWQRRQGRMMTLSGYASSRGVRGAIAETAETVFTDQLTREQQSIARRIFLRLTELNDETSTADTRRRARLDELILKPEQGESTRVVLKALADARLITTSADSVEVAHEALIREWPTLRGWLEENREGLRLHRQLTEAAQQWLELERDPDMLFRGVRFVQTQAWATTHSDDLNSLEHEFLDASQAWAEREIAEREAGRQRELEAAQLLANTQSRAAQRLRRGAVYLIAVLGFAVIAALATGFFAYRANTDFTRSEAQRLAAEADNLLLSHGDTNLIALLAIRSLNMQYTPSGDAVLTNLTTLEVPPLELKGHTDYIWGVDFSPDGKYVASGSSDKTARLCDLATGQTIHIFEGHTGEVGEVAFSPDEKYLLTAATDQTARLWDISTGETVKVFSGQTSGIDSVAFSPDGKYIVTNGFTDNTARLWDVATGETLHILTGHSDAVVRVAFSPDGKWVLTGSTDRSARLWDVNTGKQVRVFLVPNDTDAVDAVAFSPDGTYIALANTNSGDDHIARLWDISTGQLVRELTGHQGFIQGIKFSPDGRFLLAGSADKTVRLWDVASGQNLRVFNTEASQGVAFSADGSLIAAATGRIPRLWNLQSLPSGTRFIGHSSLIRGASFSPDGTRVVTASADTTARIWDTKSGQTLLILSGHTGEVSDAVFSPDGKFVLTASHDHTARLWDAGTGQELRRFEGHTDSVGKAVFSPDGKYVVTTSFDLTARTWDVKTGKTIAIYPAQNSARLGRLTFSPDGKTVAAGANDGTIHIWDPFSGKGLRIIKGHTDEVYGVAFSPDGELLVTCGHDETVRLWDVASGREVRRFIGHTGPTYGAAFSPDGKYILTSSEDETARLWDVKTGEEIRRFTGHTNQVNNVAFSPDGRYILTASFDHTARLWLADLDESIQAVCAVLTRDLTSDERTQFGISDQGSTCPAQ